MSVFKTDLKKGDTIKLPDGMHYYVHDVVLMASIQLAGVSGVPLMLTEVEGIEYERVEQDPKHNDEWRDGKPLGVEWSDTDAD